MAPTLGHGKICYLELPATDVEESARFYTSAFGWVTRRHGDGTLAFDDGVNEVSGMWVLGREPARAPGLVVSIMVDDIEAAIARVLELGGTLVRPLGADAPELTAWFADPAGNVLGLYEEPRPDPGAEPADPA